MFSGCGTLTPRRREREGLERSDLGAGYAALRCEVKPRDVQCAQDDEGSERGSNTRTNMVRIARPGRRGGNIVILRRNRFFSIKMKHGFGAYFVEPMARSVE